MTWHKKAFKAITSFIHRFIGLYSHFVGITTTVKYYLEILVQGKLIIFQIKRWTSKTTEQKATYF